MTENNEKQELMYAYTAEEIYELDEFIEKNFGPYDVAMHETESEGFHLDIIPVPPTEEDDYHKLVTMGAGAYRMSIPETLKDEELEYAEYVMLLPKDWPVDRVYDDCGWPYEILMNAARLPLHDDSWLGYGHTIRPYADGITFAESTGFNSTLLIDMLSAEGKPLKLRMSSGKLINFYLLIPLYPDELEFKKKNGRKALLDKLKSSPDYPLVNTSRKSVLGNTEH